MVIVLVEINFFLLNVVLSVINLLFENMSLFKIVHRMKFSVETILSYLLLFKIHKVDYLKNQQLLHEDLQDRTPQK